MFCNCGIGAQPEYREYRLALMSKLDNNRDQEFRLLATYWGSEGRGRPRRGWGRQWRLGLLGSRRRLKVPEVGLLQGRGRREVRGLRLEKESYDHCLDIIYGPAPRCRRPAPAAAGDTRPPRSRSPPTPRSPPCRPAPRSSRTTRIE